MSDSNCKTRAERTLEDVRIIGALMQGNHLNETELSRGRELVYALNKALEGRTIKMNHNEEQEQIKRNRYCRDAFWQKDPLVNFGLIEARP